MKWNYAVLAMMAACGGSEGEEVEAREDVPQTVAPLDSFGACLTAGGDLDAVWSVDNGHGAVEGMALGPAGKTALAGADGTIKYWVLSEQEPVHAGEIDDFNPGGMYGAEFAALAEVTAMGYDPEGTLWLGRVDGQMCRVEPGSFVPQWVSVLDGQPVHGIAPLDDERALVASRDGFGALFLVDRALGLSALSTELWSVHGVVPGAAPGEAVAIGAWYGIAAFEVVSTSDSGELTSRAVITLELPEGMTHALVPAGEHGYFFGGETPGEAGPRGFVATAKLDESLGFVAVVDDPVVATLYDAEAEILLALTAAQRLLGFSADGEPLFEVALPMQHLAWAPIADHLVGAGEHGRLVVYGCAR